MADRDEFGPHLRSARLQRGLTVAQITRATNVSAELWEGLERNDLSRWPGGIFARSYVRAYALQVGLDPEQTVDEFCRCFPAGDRRAGRVVREQAALLGHDTSWQDDLAHVDADRRAAEPAELNRPPAIFVRGARPVAAIGDCAAVLLLATIAALALHARWTTAAAVIAIGYHAFSLLGLGATPAVWAIDTYLSSRHPAERRSAAPRLLRLVRDSPQILKS